MQPVPRRNDPKSLPHLSWTLWHEKGPWHVKSRQFSDILWRFVKWQVFEITVPFLPYLIKKNYCKACYQAGLLEFYRTSLVLNLVFCFYWPKYRYRYRYRRERGWPYSPQGTLSRSQSRPSSRLIKSSSWSSPPESTRWLSSQNWVRRNWGSSSKAAPWLAR